MTTIDLERSVDFVREGGCVLTATVLLLATSDSVWGQRSRPAPTGATPAAAFSELHRMLPPDAFEPQAMLAVDVDGDGDQDLVLAPVSVDPVRLHRNDGNGVFTDASGNLPATVGHVRAIAAGDVDSDGDLDLVLGTASTSLFGGHPDRLLLNDGTGVFTHAAGNLPNVSDSTTSVALGDVDGDGDLDLLTGNEGDFLNGPEQNRLSLNDGTGFFTDATSQLPAGLDATSSIALADVDGDGDLDAIVDRGSSVLYENDGSGSFTLSALSLPGYEALALGDVDADGDVDLMLGRGGFAAFENALFLNDGAGVFADASGNLPVLADTTWDVALADVDGDGDLDALVANGAAEANRLLENDGAGVFSEAPAGSFALYRERSARLVPLDADQDGDVDVVVGTEAQDRLVLNDGIGGLDAVPEVFPVRDVTLALALADLDGDGDLDLMAGNSFAAVGSELSSDNRVYLNDGQGGFDELPSALPTFAGLVSTRAIALGDVDGDGDLDALLGTSGRPSAEQLLLGDGSGSFVESIGALPAFGGDTQDVALADLDGDGDLDAVLATGIANQEQNRLYLNDGTGVFSDATSNLPAHLDFTHSVAVGDVDGDGDLDLVLGNGRSGAAGRVDHLYANDGNAVFTDVSHNLPDQLEMTFSVDLGDVDGDGDLDLLVGNFGRQFSVNAQNRLYLNDGAGVFSDATANLPAVLDITYDARLADVNGDGFLDVVVANGSTSPPTPARNRLYLGDGTGAFVDASDALPNVDDQSRALGIGDLDGDGDVDLVVGNAPHDRVLWNLAHQVAWRGLPRLGKPLVFDLFGPPGGTWILDGPAAGLAGWGHLDAQGRASLELLVPAIPALAGLESLWRAYLGPPFASVRERTLVTVY